MEIITQALAASHTVYRALARRVRAFMESVGIDAKIDFELIERKKVGALS